MNLQDARPIAPSKPAPLPFWQRLAHEKFYFDSLVTHIIGPLNTVFSVTTLFLVSINFLNLKLSLWWVPVFLLVGLVVIRQLSRYLARRKFYEFYQSESNRHNALLQSLKKPDK